jgi:hypothetical protein
LDQIIETRYESGLKRKEEKKVAVHASLSGDGSHSPSPIKFKIGDTASQKNLDISKLQPFTL